MPVLITSPALHLVAALAIGLAYGAVAARSHFCTMGALADFCLFGGTRRLRGVVAAAGTALLGLGIVRLLGTGEVALPTSWLAAPLGGFAMGVGMTLSGGCISRNLVRAGAGSIRAAVTLLVTATAGLVTATGILAGPAMLLGRPHLWLALDGRVVGMAGLVLGLVALAWAGRPGEFARARTELATGVLLGLLVPAWHLLIPTDPGEIAPSFALPLDATLLYLQAPGVLTPTIVLVLAVLAAAALTARLTGSWRVEGFGDRTDLLRHLGGALLMGAGGTLAAADSFGNAVSGVGALLPSAFLATAAMVLGCWRTLAVLAGGSFLPYAIGRSTVTPGREP